MIEATEPLSLRIALAMTASCSCMTKTNDPMFHAERCLYRVLTEALEIIDPDSYVALHPSPPPPSMFD